MPRRRLSLMVAAGALAVVALAGCRAEPGSAAFVGGTTYQKSAIDTMVSQYRTDGGKIDPADEYQLRGEIMRDEVFVDVAGRYAQDHDFGSPKVDTQSLADQSGLPASDPFLQLYAKKQGYLDLLNHKVKPVEPTDAELRDVYGYLVKAAGVTAPYDQIAPQLRALDGFGAAIAVRRELTGALKRYNVVVNPLYDADFTLLSVQGQSGGQIDVVVLSLAGNASTGVVHDVSP